MQSLEDEEWLQGLGKEEFIERLAHYYCEINVLHPFVLAMALPSGFSLSSLRCMPDTGWTGVASTRKTGVKRTRPGRWAT
jgi:hypothetical protein